MPSSGAFGARGLVRWGEKSSLFGEVVRHLRNLFQWLSFRWMRDMFAGFVAFEQSRVDQPLGKKNNGTLERTPLSREISAWASENSWRPSRVVTLDIPLWLHFSHREGLPGGAGTLRMSSSRSAAIPTIASRKATLGGARWDNFSPKAAAAAQTRGASVSIGPNDSTHLCFPLSLSLSHSLFLLTPSHEIGRPASLCLFHSFSFRLSFSASHSGVTWPQ